MHLQELGAELKLYLADNFSDQVLAKYDNTQAIGLWLCEQFRCVPDRKALLRMIKSCQNGEEFFRRYRAEFQMQQGNFTIH